MISACTITSRIIFFMITVLMIKQLDVLESEHQSKLRYQIRKVSNKMCRLTDGNNAARSVGGETATSFSRERV